MASIEPYCLSRTQETIAAELHAATDYRWKLIEIAADFQNCQLPKPFVVGPKFDDLIRMDDPPKLPPELKEALRLSALTIALLERELSDAHQRWLNERP